MRLVSSAGLQQGSVNSSIVFIRLTELHHSSPAVTLASWIFFETKCVSSVLDFCMIGLCLCLFQKQPFILMYEERFVDVASYVCHILDQIPASPVSPMYVDWRQPAFPCNAWHLSSQSYVDSPVYPHVPKNRVQIARCNKKVLISKEKKRKKRSSLPRKRQKKKKKPWRHIVILVMQRFFYVRGKKRLYKNRFYQITRRTVMLMNKNSCLLDCTLWTVYADVFAHLWTANM